MTPGEATMRAAAAYERGLKPVTHLIDVADEQSAAPATVTLPRAPPPTLPERIVWLPAVWMIMPRIGRMRCSHVPCCWRNVDGIRLATWMS